ncbi:MAG TPA: permease-like cell division protein FtsX [Ureibacillus sp.]|nr:permease-like cell division protein FtsX [Ureibacillus sp.]
MNKQQFNYMLEDIKLGLKRNLGSTTASISLLFIALVLIGFVLLSRIFVQDAVSYVESQLAMKVYVEDGLVEDVAAILQKQSYATDVEIETGDDTMKQLAFFFEGKEHLLKAFTDGSVPDAVKFQVTDPTYMASIAENLSEVDGILRVVYPQKMAQQLSHWVDQVELYGTIVIIVFLALAFCMVFFTSRLAIYQRQKELKVKLLLGMNPKVVRYQFLLEGFVMGCIGALFSFIITGVMYSKVFLSIQHAIPYIGQLTMMNLIVVLILQGVLAIALSMTASYLCTRKMIAYV